MSSFHDIHHMVYGVLSVERADLVPPYPPFVILSRPFRHFFVKMYKDNSGKNSLQDLEEKESVPLVIDRMYKRRAKLKKSALGEG